MESKSTTLHMEPAAQLAPRSLADLPGPPGWPLLGNFPQMKAARIHRDVEGWARQYGPLFKMRFGPLPVLVVARHETVNAVLRDRPDGFRRPRVTANVSDELGGRPGLFLAEGKAWRDQRRMVMSGFAPHAIKAYFPALVTVALRLQGRWRAAAADGRDIDLMDDLKRYTVDIIAGLAFGAEVNTIDGGGDVIQRHLDQVLPGVARRGFAWFPYWRYVRLPSDRRLERSMAAINGEITALIVAAARAWRPIRRGASGPSTCWRR